MNQRYGKNIEEMNWKTWLLEYINMMQMFTGRDGGYGFSSYVTPQAVTSPSYSYSLVG